MNKHFVLRALDRAGAFGYYTGKAGPEYVSNKRDNAFTYETFEGARRKADVLESMTGLTFVVVE